MTFYLAALAANDGQGTNGDYTYTATLSSAQTQTGLNDESTWSRIKRMYQ